MVASSNPPEEATEMLSKTRTTIITLVAAFSFAGAAIVPTVSQARMKKTPAEEQHCEELGLEFEFWADKYNKDALNHRTKKVLKNDIAEGTRAWEEARLFGCDWTGLKQPPANGLPTEGLRPEGEPKSLTEPGSPPPARLAPLPPAGALA
jgi:hypothetical protein